MVIEKITLHSVIDSDNIRLKVRYTHDGREQIDYGQYNVPKNLYYPDTDDDELYDKLQEAVEKR